jgi:O-antigen/teichoic acid export membrane protein
MLSAAARQRFNSVATGTLANVLGQILNIGGQLALVPILLHYWGTEIYGEWLALSAMVTYLATLDLGMQTYVVNRLNQCYSVNDMEEYTRVLHTGFLVNLLIPALGFAVTLPLILMAPLTKWLQLRDTDPSTAAWVTVLLSLQVVYSIGYGVVVGIYRTINEYARGQMIMNVRFLFNVLLTVGIVLYGGQMRAVATAQLALLVATSILVYIDLVRRRPEIRIGFSRADWRLGLQFIGPSSMFLGIQISGAVAIQGSTILVSSMFGAATLVVFASLRTLSNMIKQATATVQLALWPEFTALDAQSEQKSLRMLHLLGAKVVMAIAVCSTVFLITVGDRLVAFWTRGRIAYDEALMVALLVWACSQAHWFSSAILISACNRQKIVLRAHATAAIGGFLLGYVLAHWFGVVGFVYGLAGADIVICGIGLPYLACKTIGESRLKFFNEVTARSALLLAATYFGVRFVLPLAGAAGNGVRDFVSAGLLTCILGAVAAYVMALNSFERNRLHAAVAGIFAR